MSLRALVLLVLAVGATLAALRAYDQQSPAGRWERELWSDDPSVRLAAAALVRGRGAIDPERVFARLVETLNDPDPAVRAQAARSLVAPVLESGWRRGAPPDPPMVEQAWRELIVLLDDPDPAARAAAIGSLAALARQGVHPDETTSRLLAALGEPDVSVRWAAGLALQGGPHLTSGIRPRTPEARDAWLVALDDPEVHIREFALKGLAIFGEEEPVCREIIRRLEDPELRIRDAAGNALDEIPMLPPGVAADLLGVLRRHPDRLDRLSRTIPEIATTYHWVSVDGYAMVGGTNSHATAVALNGQISDNAAEALGRIGPVARGALPDLGSLLEDARARRDDWQTVAIAEAIVGIAPESAEGARAVDALVELLRDDPSLMSDFVPVVAPIISGSWNDPTRPTADSVTALVARFGAHAATALPALWETAVRSADEDLRQRAQSVIDEIEASLGASVAEAP